MKQYVDERLENKKTEPECPTDTVERSIIPRPRLDEKKPIKHDAGKIRVSLVPFECIMAIAVVMTEGAKKYGDHNWKGFLANGEDRVIDAGFRHHAAIQKGEAYDQDTGLLHAAHKATNALFELWFELQRHPLKYPHRIQLADAADIKN
jgi:hypothetical protein